MTQTSKIVCKKLLIPVFHGHRMEIDRNSRAEMCPSWWLKDITKFQPKLFRFIITFANGVFDLQTDKMKNTNLS